MVKGDEEEQDGEELVAREVRSARRAKTAPLPCPPRNTRTPRSPAQCPPRASFMWLVGRDGAKRLCLNSGRVPCHVCLAQTACLSHGCTPLSACLHRAPLPTHSTTTLRLPSLTLVVCAILVQTLRHLVKDITNLTRPRWMASIASPRRTRWPGCAEPEGLAGRPQSALRPWSVGSVFDASM